MAGKKDYTVQSPVVHDGQRFEIGETISLEDQHAGPLLAVRAILAKPEAPRRKKAAEGEG